jgi:ankyrin repeat protein
MNCDQQHTQDDIIDCLVNAGANMTITENDYRRTPLHSAICCRRVCHARKFIQLGSPINTADSREETPLITALKMNNQELSKLLLTVGATFQPGSCGLSFMKL